MFDFQDIRGRPCRVHPGEIREIRAAPDTTMILADGNCFLCLEPAAELVARLMRNPRQLEYRNRRFIAQERRL